MDSGSTQNYRRTQGGRGIRLEKRFDSPPGEREDWFARGYNSPNDKNHKTFPAPRSPGSSGHRYDSYRPNTGPTNFAPTGPRGKTALGARISNHRRSPPYKRRSVSPRPKRDSIFDKNNNKPLPVSSKYSNQQTRPARPPRSEQKINSPRLSNHEKSDNTHRPLLDRIGSSTTSNERSQPRESLFPPQDHTKSSGGPKQSKQQNSLFDSSRRLQERIESPVSQQQSNEIPRPFDARHFQERTRGSNSPAPLQQNNLSDPARSLQDRIGNTSSQKDSTSLHDRINVQRGGRKRSFSPNLETSSKKTRHAHENTTAERYLESPYPEINNEQEAPTQNRSPPTSEGVQPLSFLNRTGTQNAARSPASHPVTDQTPQTSNTIPSPISGLPMQHNEQVSMPTSNGDTTISTIVAPSRLLALVDIGASPHPDLLVEVLGEPILLELQRRGFTRLRIAYGEHRHIYALLVRKSRSFTGITIHIHGVSDILSVLPQASLVISHSGPLLRKSLEQHKPLIVVGYDGWMTEDQRDILRKLYSRSKLAVSRCGDLLGTLKELNVDALQSTSAPLPAELDQVPDALEPRLQQTDLDDILDEVSTLAKPSVASSIGPIDSNTRLPPKPKTTPQIPKPDILEWLQSIRVAQFQEPPLPNRNLREAIDGEANFRKMLVHVERARAEEGFPRNLPAGLNIFRDAIVRDYEEEQELQMKRVNRIKDVKDRIRKEVEQFRVTGTFPLKRFVWKEPIIDHRKEVSLMREKRQSKKRLQEIIKIKRERISPPPQFEDPTAGESPTSDGSNSETPPTPTVEVAVDAGAPISNTHIAWGQKLPEDALEEMPPLPTLSPDPPPCSPPGFRVGVAIFTPRNSTQPTFDKPTPTDIAIIYRIVSTFPITELWVIPRVFIDITKRDWTFSNLDDTESIAKMITTHLKFYTYADGILFVRDIKNLCSSRYPLPAELTLDRFAERITQLTSALRPKNDHVKKIWKLAYSEILSLRYIGGRIFENYDQIQLARGCAPLSDAERPKYVDDFVEYVADRVRSARGTWDVETITKRIDQRNAEEVE